MGAQLGGKGAFSDINMTPLIDIVLVVLIIMMVNIPIQIEEMGLNLPSPLPPPADQEPNPDQLVVMLYHDSATKETQLGLNRRIMKEDELFYELTRRLKPMSNKIVFIDSHPEVDYGRVIDMVDMSREAGAEKVAFAKMKETGPLEATSVSPGSMPRGVTFGSPSVVGEMTEKRAYTSFEPFQGAVTTCYAAALGANPAAGGRLVVSVDVGPAGEIMATAPVTDTVGDSQLMDCVLAVLPSLKFEALGDQKTARIHYPFLMSPG
ncbi:MAG TPA: biopolymer transporter ExbD [Myxococcota bacterium]|nr:biopolymer transporter ExbD [Myxococcota bacterium]